MGVELYHIALTLSSPAIVSAKGSERGLLYTVASEVISGPTFHGALVRAIAFSVHLGTVDELHALQTFVTPLYPTTARDNSLYRDVTVTHALSAHGKGYASNIVVSYNIGGVIELLEYGMSLDEALMKVISDYAEVLQSFAMRSGIGLSINVADLKSAQGMPIERTNVSSVEVWRRVKVRKGVYLENAVDRARGSAYAGALYGYEYIASGTVFTGYVACVEGKGLCNHLPSINGSEILIGKGQGRGFGRARVEVKRVNVEDVVKVCCPLEERLIALIALSPSFIVDPIPRPVGVNDTLETLSSTKLAIRYVIGSRVDTYTGWSRLRHGPKLTVRGNALGTILIAEVVNGKLTERLCLELMFGMFRNSLPGFNVFHVVRRDPLYISPENFINLLKGLLE